MDPNETLRQLSEARIWNRVTDDLDAAVAAQELILELEHWLAKGGFQPDWSVAPELKALVRGAL